MAPYIKSPLFVMNSRFDPACKTWSDKIFACASISFVAVDSISEGENGNNNTNVNRIGAELIVLVNSTVMNRPDNAAFITSCHQHCGQWYVETTYVTLFVTKCLSRAQGQTGSYGDFNVTIDGWTAVPALQTWYTGGPGARNYWLQEAKYPCAQCCNGGQQ
jgi:hypothetical protein